MHAREKNLITEVVTELWQECERKPRVFVLDSVHVPPRVPELKKKQFVTKLSQDGNRDAVR